MSEKKWDHWILTFIWAFLFQDTKMLGSTLNMPLNKQELDEALQT
jgi:hypothetical protein